MDRDREHLRLLSTFHYVLAALAAVFSCMFVIHIVMGVAMLGGAMESDHDRGPPRELGWMFVVIGGLGILVGWTYAVLLFTAARALASFRRRMLCFVVAGISCAFTPLGTVLGVFTIVVLSRPSVRALFEPLPTPAEA